MTGSLQPAGDDGTGRYFKSSELYRFRGRGPVREAFGLTRLAFEIGSRNLEGEHHGHRSREGYLGGNDGMEEKSGIDFNSATGLLREPSNSPAYTFT